MLNSDPETLMQNSSNQQTNQNFEKAASYSQVNLLNPIVFPSNTGTIQCNKNEIKSISHDINQTPSELQAISLEHQNEHKPIQKELTSVNLNLSINNQVGKFNNPSRNLISDEAKNTILEILKILKDRDKKLSDKEILFLKQLNNNIESEYLQLLIKQNEANENYFHNNYNIPNGPNSVRTNQIIDIFEESLQSDTHFIKMNEFYNFQQNIDICLQKTEISQNLEEIDKLLFELQQENPQEFKTIEESKELTNGQSRFIAPNQSKKENVDIFNILQSNKENSILNRPITNEIVLVRNKAEIIGNKEIKKEFKSEEDNSLRLHHTKNLENAGFHILELNNLKVNELQEYKKDIDLFENCNDMKNQKKLGKIKMSNYLILFT